MSNKYELLMYIHKLEKALHMPNRKVLFGQAVALKIKSLLGDKSLPGDIVKTAKVTLKKYNQLLKSEPIKYNSNAISIKDLYILASQRKSIRNFSAKNVSVNKIKKAIDIARYMPSACNRQPCEVILIKNKELKKHLLSIHCGNAGIVSPMLAVITFDEEAFFQENEQGAGMLHAGLFSSAFILGLQAQGINSCAMNWHVDNKTDNKANKILSLPVNKKIALLIMIGYSNKKAESFSYKVKNKDILKILD